ncbi:peptidyl-prolyl cis-trans isomerase [Planctomycetota bacterium]|nr:peptidyl-prolyl cis-trans isomerase [Planctomycetota bacterium]
MILIPLLLSLCQQTTAPAFSTPRILLSVNQQHIHSDEVNDLVKYYRTYREQESTASLIRRAIATLIPQKLMLAVLASEAKELEEQIASIHTELVNGGDFEQLAMQFSQDSEAPTADGRYTFKREQTVHPFDLYSFTTAVNDYSPAFITKYGYHILQPLHFIDGATPADLKVEVRHILLMYPTMTALEENEQDVREYIEHQRQQAKIVICDFGLKNMVAHDLRDQVTISSLAAAPSVSAAD